MKKFNVSFDEKIHQEIGKQALFLGISEVDLIREVTKAFIRNLPRDPGHEMRLVDARFFMETELATKTHSFLEALLRRSVPKEDFPGLIEEINRNAADEYDKALLQYRKLSGLTSDKGENSISEDSAMEYLREEEAGETNG